MAIKQLSIFVENKQGRLVEITKMLADSGVNMRALSIADTRDFGILRLIVDDTQKACLVLAENSVMVKITDVVAVEMPHRTGSLNAALTVLSNAGINVEYLYAFLSSSGQGAYVVLRVADNAQAEQALKDAGYNVLSDEDQIE
ncbi:MAG: amino acid-binding protein [Firmicutes bacterium]|nr:amino acid-binding protein [Bacillota bacterium]